MKALLLTLALLASTAPQESKPVQDAKADAHAAEAPADAAVVREQLPSYPLTTCVISGEPLGSMGDALDHVVDGRLVRLCCAGCVKGVEKDKDAVIAKIDKAVIRAQGPSYPLKECPVSHEALGKDPHEMVVGTRLVRTCCAKCAKEVAKDPRPTLKQIDAALIAEQKKTYPATTCVVSNEPLGDGAVDHLYGTQLVRLCCKSCVRVFEKSPQTYLAGLKKKS